VTRATDCHNSGSCSMLLTIAETVRCLRLNDLGGMAHKWPRHAAPWPCKVCNLALLHFWLFFLMSGQTTSNDAKTALWV
jgi:hypothetical protein